MWHGTGISAYRHIGTLLQFACQARAGGACWCRRYETGKVMYTGLADVSVSNVSRVTMPQARLWGRLLRTFKVIRGTCKSGLEGLI